MGSDSLSGGFRCEVSDVASGCVGSGVVSGGFHGGVQGSQPGWIQNLSFSDVVLQVAFQRRETLCAQPA